jgi:FdhD protein
MKLILPREGIATHQTASRMAVPLEGTCCQEESPLLVEHMLEVYLNEVPTYELICSPTMLAELVLGRLLTEGIIQNKNQVDMIYLCKDGLRARVFLQKSPEQEEGNQPETVPTCCTGNRTLSHLFQDKTPPETLTPIPYEAEWIFRLSAAINQNTPIYAATHSAHSCILMHQGKILVCAEDIGRHNAMDKVIGWGLLHDIPLEQCMLYTSGRVPVDMTLKAIRAGVPILVSKAQPTDKALELAKEFRLTLIGAAHPDRFQVYSNGEDSPQS